MRPRMLVKMKPSKTETMKLYSVPIYRSRNTPVTNTAKNATTDKPILKHGMGFLLYASAGDELSTTR